MKPERNGANSSIASTLLSVFSAVRTLLTDRVGVVACLPGSHDNQSRRLPDHCDYFRGCVHVTHICQATRNLNVSTCLGR